jgi:SpoOM protein
MGLFDAFGVGGGNLSIEVQFAQAQAGGGLQGTVVFQAGRRAQQITNVTVKVTCTTWQKVPNGLQQNTQDIVGPLQVAGAFAAQPGQRYTMPFQAMLPGGLFSTTPNAVSYRLSTNADIDGEVDPGAGMDIQVNGEPFMPQGMMPMGGQQMGDSSDSYAKNVKGDPNAKGGGDPYAKGMGGGFAPGQHCLAQWTDGQYYGVTVVQAANGMFMVQWDDGTPASWVRGDQIAQG